MKPFVLMTLALVLLAGCSVPGTAAPGPEATAPAPPVTATAAPQPTQAGADTPAPDAAPTAGLPAGLAEVGRQALAAALSVPLSEVTLEQMEEAEWADASLGCPAPGAAYPQVVTPGYRFVYSVGEVTYEVHADQQGRLALCTAAGEPLLPTQPSVEG